MQWTLENIQTGILWIKEVANNLEVNEEGIEQLVNDLY